jgi:hypothetical protein
VLSVAHELRQDQKNKRKSLMAEGQNKRQISKDMKSLGNKRVKPQKETEKMSEQSTNEGQRASILEAVLEPQEWNETPGNLDPAFGRSRAMQSDSRASGSLHYFVHRRMYRASRSRPHCRCCPNLCRAEFQILEWMLKRSSRPSANGFSAIRGE